MQRYSVKDLLIYHPNMDSQSTIQLLAAFENGNLAKVQQHLTKSNVNQSIGVCGYLPVELSIIFDHKHIFNFLVYDLDANTNVKNKTFESLPFIALAYQRNQYLFELLDLDISGLYESTNDSHRTLMHQAALYGDVKTVETLLEYFGFYRNLNDYELKHLLYDKYGCSPLYYACWFGNTQIVDLLLAASSTPARELNSDSWSDDDNPSDDLMFISPSGFQLGGQKFSFDDASLAISILYKRFDCSRLLLTRSLDAPCIQQVSNLNDSSELDSWFSSAMKLNCDTEFVEMCNLFHELILNGAKFTNNLFGFIDSMTDKVQFNTSGYSKKTFFYNSYLSNFLKCLTFMSNYDLRKLFSSEKALELFFKSVFLKINEVFLTQNNWQVLDTYFFSRSNNNNNSPSFQLLASKQYVQHNRPNLEWFIYDYEQLLRTLYSNGYAFRYFAKKGFFNILRKYQFLYFLIEACLYNESDSVIANLGDYEFEGVSRYLDYMQVKALCWLKRPQLVVKPLSLVNLTKAKVKSSLSFLDKDLIARLQLPTQLKVLLGNGLAVGLENSYERSQMNLRFSLEKVK